MKLFGGSPKFSESFKYHFATTSYSHKNVKMYAGDKMKSRQITLRVPEEIYQRLIDLTEKKGRLKVQEIIREAINEYIERECGVVYGKT